MTCSMTAFARAEQRLENASLVWELRSVNHRFLEMVVRLPEEFRALEPGVREILSKLLGRGKVDCSLRYHREAGVAGPLSVNSGLVGELVRALALIGEQLPGGSSVSLTDLLQWPGVVQSQQENLDSLEEDALGLLREAAVKLVDIRRREGAQLAEVISQRCLSLRALVDEVRVRMPQVLAGIRERLMVRLSEVTAELDEHRLEQEMVFLTQRLDVDEEMERLRAHIEAVEAALRQSNPVGRRLDFLMQELNREANTLSSKSVDLEVTRLAVDMKVCIEQMREQVQNIE